MKDEPTTVVTATIPRNVVQRLDEAARRHGHSRSSWMAYVLANDPTGANLQRALEQHATDNIDDEPLPDDGLSTVGMQLDPPHTSKRRLSK